jgi:hypothetical protein
VDFVHRSEFYTTKKSQSFRNWICLRPQVREGTHLLCCIPKFSTRYVFLLFTISSDGQSLESQCYCQLLPIEGCRVVSVAETSTAINLSFLDWSRYLSVKYLHIYPHEDEWTSFQTYYYSKKSSSAGSRNQDLWVCSPELFDH